MGKITLKSGVNKTIKDGFTEYINSCLARNYSKYTIKYYENSMHNFGLFVDLDEQINIINQNLLDKYVIYLSQKKGLSSNSIATYVKGLRTIFYHFAEVGYIDGFIIRLPLSHDQIKETYTIQELEVLLKKPNIKTCEFSEYRNWVIINYLISTGNMDRLHLIGQKN